MLKYISLPLLCLFISCSNYGQLTFISKLPKKIDEASGMVSISNHTTWVIQDHGNEDIIYQVNDEGKLLEEFKVKNAKNQDWEDLAKDEHNNVYIADTGNNNNKRDDLVIYKIPNPEVEGGDKIDAEQIRFSYPEQDKFPPKNKELYYDSEALFYHQGFLYIITKNRTSPFNAKTFIYKVPAKKGTYKAQRVGEFVPCTEKGVCLVTAADISPDGSKIALLGYGKLWIFTDFTLDDFSKGHMETIDLGATTQLESVYFRDNDTLIISDEERGNTGGNLYSYRLP